MSHPPPPPPGWEPPREHPPSTPPQGGGWPVYGSPPPPGGAPPPPYGAPPPGPRRTGLLLALLGGLVVLALGVGVAAAVVLVNDDDGSAADDPTTAASADDDPTDEPTDEPSPTEEPTEEPDVLDDPEPTETGGANPDSRPREKLKAEDYREDWNFRFGDAEAFAAFKDAWDHPTCAPVEKGSALTGRGCRYAVESTYVTRDGKLQLTNVFLGMKSDLAARRTQQKLKGSDFKVQPASTLPGVSGGSWRATAQAEIVVLTLVTARPDVKDERVRHYLNYANTDFSSALIFR